MQYQHYARTLYMLFIVCAAPSTHGNNPDTSDSTGISTPIAITCSLATGGIGTAAGYVWGYKSHDNGIITKLSEATHQPKHPCLERHSTDLYNTDVSEQLAGNLYDCLRYHNTDFTTFIRSIKQSHDRLHGMIQQAADSNAQLTTTRDNLLSQARQEQKRLDHIHNNLSNNHDTLEAYRLLRTSHTSFDPHELNRIIREYSHNQQNLHAHITDYIKHKHNNYDRVTPLARAYYEAHHQHDAIKHKLHILHRQTTQNTFNHNVIQRLQQQEETLKTVLDVLDNDPDCIEQKKHRAAADMQPIHDKLDTIAHEQATLSKTITMLYNTLTSMIKQLTRVETTVTVLKNRHDQQELERLNVPGNNNGNNGGTSQ